ncbi:MULTISPECIES: inorganic diphosphatase [Alteromonadaceae]|uniref:inorganic diphosphatase n=1 Tax=Alteromonadaceae TaxID=72275 RepID=UPI001C08CB13|nr:MULTISPECIES: inorganic diphosphatase [Aliiglaciecola]MBU2880239.1 inorganic diphosphatase [Aliiglaciecola lipolytica]MDO6712663.1 inorganic diphosphatase [Aliiglaciecola sp. 2_MG-2023]MDO6754394.1 inorganic diphosphatase [Aliiglaciecola sp. 1_MG-2023]
MSLNAVPAGKNLPDEVNVIIEIPAHADPVKYEVDKDTGAIFVDRFMATCMHYPTNYGYVPQTLSLDGDPVDVLVMTPFPLLAGSVIKCRPVGVLKMTDESGEDAKVLAVPIDKLSTIYREVKEIDQVPELTKQQIEHFFAHYKDLEPNKWVKIEGWGNCEDAKAEIVDSVKRYQTEEKA